MDAAHVDPELRAARGRGVDIPSHRWWGRALMRVAVAAFPAVHTPGVTREVVRHGRLRARVHRPNAPRTDAVLLWVHGGGYILGGAVMDDRFCGRLAARLGMTVVAAEYRLAPRHPFPAAHDDVRAVWRWIADGGLGEGVLEPQRIVVAGGSAGGGIAAGLVLRLCDEGASPGGQLLIAPMLDDRTALRRELDPIEHWVWSNRDNRVGWSAYLQAEAGAADADPYAVPARRDDLSGLPPTWIGVGDVDLFHDEDAAYARRLERAGVPTSLRVVPGAPHGFEAWASETRCVRMFLEDARAWLAERIDP